MTSKIMTWGEPRVLFLAVQITEKTPNTSSPAWKDNSSQTARRPGRAQAAAAPWAWPQGSRTSKAGSQEGNFCKGGCPRKPLRQPARGRWHGALPRPTPSREQSGKQTLLPSVQWKTIKPGV